MDFLIQNRENSIVLFQLKFRIPPEHFCHCSPSMSYLLAQTFLWNIIQSHPLLRLRNNTNIKLLSSNLCTCATH